MERIQHFSHPEHPLILKKLGEKEEEVKCYGCQEAITEKDNYYACEEGSTNCSFYLHRKCADLPREINLPCHKHPLTLFASSPYRSGLVRSCGMCQRSDWKWFTYHCYLCRFDMDVICSSIRQERNNIVVHEAHLHPLTVNLRPSMFRCDACNTKDRDLSYFCNTCQFWIHKSCASAPKSITVAHHDDPLLLTYFLPLKHRTFPQYCEICHKRVLISDWVYYCDNCRYFNHLKCALTAPAAAADTSNGPALTASESEIQGEEGDTESSQLMIFPLPNQESLDRISLFVAQNSTSGSYDNGATEIRHRLHQHPLSIHNDAGNVQAYDEIVCDGCVRPISVPFYSCSECNFFLHRFCSELPEELGCPHDSRHSIKVNKYEVVFYFDQCSFCLRCCNGFVCQCVSCDLKLDIGCASNLIPRKIKHNCHRHTLVRSHLPRGETNHMCNACSNPTGGSHTYSCKACSFNLCIFCVSYPGSVTHEYDRHSIPLRYPPIKDHPSDFICEICEKDINPRYWMYHCQDCNQSFHTHCLSPPDWYSNLKFGGIVGIDDIHQHPLAFVRNSRSEFSSPCDQCGQDRNGEPILECAPCGFKLCLPCASISINSKGVRLSHV